MINHQTMISNPDEKGFTLIEILVAIAIFSIGMLGIAGMQLQATSANTTARLSTELGAFAADQMENLTRNSIDDFPDGNDVALTNTQINNLTGLSLDGSNTTSNGDFIVNCTVDQDAIVENTKTLTLTVTDTRRGGDQTLTFEHIIPKM